MRQPMGFSLVIREGPGVGETLRFDQLEVTFGRIPGNDVVLQDSAASRKHFSIVIENERHLLEDLGSSNGTLLNGQPVTSAPLSHGDEIQVGGLVFEFQLDASARNLPARRQKVGPRQAPVAAAMGPQGSHQSLQLARQSGTALQAKRGSMMRGGLAATLPMSARERFKVRREASTPIGRLRVWFRGLDPRQRLLVLIGSGIATLGLLFFVMISLGGDEALAGLTDYSDSVMSYDPGVQDWVFGYGVDELNRQARNNLGFSFPYRDGRVTLVLDAGFIENESEVEIRLNETRLVGYAPLSIGTWVRDVQLVLPQAGLVPNTMNTLVFDQIRNPGARPPAIWAIRNLRIREEPLPSPDPVRAQERFDLGERRWRGRAISPRNLHDACRNYQEARDYLERLPEKPVLYAEVEAKVRECATELDAIHRRLVFEVQRFERFRDWDRAKATLLQILEYFPDETDPRNMTVQDWLRDYY